MRFYIIEQCKRNGDSYNVRRFVSQTPCYGRHQTTYAWITAEVDVDRGAAVNALIVLGGPHTYAIRVLTMEEE